MQLAKARHEACPRGQAGFTIPEILVAMAGGLVLLAAVHSFNRSQLFTLRNQANQLDVQTAARSVADLFAREVRRAGTDPTCGGKFSGIVAARSDQLRIQSDLNGNGVIDAKNEDVTYTYDFLANTVARSANGTTDVLISGLGIAGSGIRYFDRTGTELIPQGTPPALSAPQRDQVRRVRIQLALQGHAADPRDSAPLTARIATDIDLRNRFFVSGTACP